MTAFVLNRRQQISLAVWPVVAFACFSLACARALFVAITHAGPAPTLATILGRVEWGSAIQMGVALAAPAGVLSILQARFERVRYVDSTLASLIVAAIALAALWFAFQAGPSLVDASGGNVPIGGPPA
jgi:hypothetical protein